MRLGTHMQRISPVTPDEGVFEIKKEEKRSNLRYNFAKIDPQDLKMV
jgi:hypothetical protein